MTRIHGDKNTEVTRIQITGQTPALNRWYRIPEGHQMDARGKKALSLERNRRSFAKVITLSVVI